MLFTRWFLRAFVPLLLVLLPLLALLPLFPALTGVANAPAGAAAATAAPIVGAGTRGAGSLTTLELAPAPLELAEAAAPLELAEAAAPLEPPAPISLLLAQEKNRSTRL